jgi:hypothetical protein
MWPPTAQNCASDCKTDEWALFFGLLDNFPGFALAFFMISSACFSHFDLLDSL